MRKRLQASPRREGYANAQAFAGVAESDKFPEDSIVWITSGVRGEPKHKLYTAFIDKVRVKTMGTLTSADLGHQNPEINSVEELVADFEKIYKRRVTKEDTVTVIYFSEVHEDL